MTGRELNQIIRQIGFVVLLVGLSALVILKLNYFVSSFLGAFTIYMLLRKPHQYLLSKGWNKTLATIVLLTIIVVVIFVVGGVLVGTLYTKLKGFQPQLLMNNVSEIHEFILRKTGYNIFSPTVVNKAIQQASQMLPNIFAATGNIFLNVVMMVFLLFFLLRSSRQMESSIERNLPLTDNSIQLLKNETQNMVVSNAIGIPVIMIGQGLAAGIGYWLLGAGDPIGWGVLTGVFGVIPIVGTTSIWLPLAINLMISGQVWQGIVLIVYSLLIVGGVDSAIRMVVMRKYANVHPLITIFGIIIGLNLFGFWGIIFGPLLLSGCMVLFKIYKKEFLEG